MDISCENARGNRLSDPEVDIKDQHCCFVTKFILVYEK